MSRKIRLLCVSLLTNLVRSLDVYERILREVRARHRTYISKVILHPSKVIEIQIKKEKTVTRAGQWIFL